MRQFLTVIAAVITICLISSVAAREIDTRGVPINTEETIVDDESSLQGSKLNTVHYSPLSVNQFKDSGMLAEKPGHDKLETALSNMLDIYLSNGISAAEDYAFRHRITLNNGLVLTELNLHDGYLTDSIELDVLRRYGVEVDSRSRNFIIVRVPIGDLGNFAAALDAVSLLHRPYEPVREIVSEGFELVGGAGFHDQDILGEGVNIGVFDIGYALSTQARNAGELPEFTARNFTEEGFNQGNVHGTACAEIIYDFVPEADLYLVKISNSAHFENALEYAFDNEIDIVSMSLGWRVPMGDYFRGEDRMSVMVNDAYEDGLFFIQSAGNSADAHYRDDFDDQRQDDHYHRFANGIVVNNFGAVPDRNFEFERGTLLSVSLIWDDFPRSDQDFDLELVQLNDDEWEMVDRSNNRQNGDDNPIEEIEYIVENSGEFGVRVLRYDADNGMDFTLNSYPYDLGYHTSAGSITIPAIAEDCFAVGAINYRFWERDNPSAEDFSSRGPTYDGRIKPDIAAPDGVSTYAYGQMDRRFFGTSAACPHVAGAAALVLSNDLNLNAANIREYLEDNAIDIGDEGPDNNFGYGKLSIEPEDPGEPPSGDSIYYDDGDPASLFTVVNYWSKVTFTVHGDGFELGGVRFMPYNPAPNPNAPCRVRIYSEGDNHQLDELIWETEIEELDRWNGNDIDANWIWLDIPENDRPVFNNRDNFTVMYGPAPGGDYDPDNMEEGDGWWNLTDEETEDGRSSYFEGDDPAVDHGDWVEIESDLFIRAFRPPEVEEQPEISVEPESLDFGEVQRGENEERTVTIRNLGNADLIVSGVIVEGAFWEYFDLNFREQVIIEPDDSWELIVTFSPQEVGEVVATLVISSNDPDNEEITVDMAGVGLGDAVIRVEPDFLDFGVVELGDREVLILTISNIGSADLDVWDIGLQGNYFSVDFEDGFIIEPGNSYELPVAFEPWESGEFSGTLFISSNDPVNGDVSVELFGIVEVDAEINVDPESLDFETVFIGDGADLILTISNLGSENLIVSGVDSEGDWFTVAFEGEITIEPESRQQLTVTFAPEEEGEFEGALVINSNDPQNSEVRVNLHGIGEINAVGDDQLNAIPGSFYLSAASPNPFNAVTRLTYGLPTGSWVSMRIYDSSGRLISTLVERFLPAGRYGAVWNGSNTLSGIYLVRMKADGFSRVRKVVLTK